MLRSVFLCLWIVFSAVFQSVAGTNTRHNIDFQLPKVQIDTPKKPNILKQLSEAIKFRKKAITQEQKRVQSIIESMISKDSSLATVQDLAKLKEDLAESNKQQFDMLLELIKEIKITPTGSTPVIEQPSQANPNPNKPFQIQKELDPNDKYINDLVDRLIPILSDTKEFDDKIKARQERLKLIRAIYNGKTLFADTINDSTVRRYRLHLSHRGDVMANYPYEAMVRSNQYNLSTITSLLYNSYDIDPANGLARNINNWEKSYVISDAQKAGSKVLLTVTTLNSAETAKFLTNPSAIRNLINNTLKALKQRDADGINIALTGLNPKLRIQFVEFVNLLSKAYRKESKRYQINITLPVYDQAKAYNIPGLDTLTDKFIINFSKKPTNFPGAIAPLKDDSDYNIESCVSRYLNVGLPPYKFILCLSYYGAQFSINPATGTEIFKGYVPYKDIRLNYQYAPVSYDEEQASASIETRDNDGNLTGHIYYDNETSLEQKYDFIIQSGLGGVAIWQLGADEGYGELWDALANKFISIDTISTDIVSLRHPRPKSSSLWEYIKTNMVAYYHALQHPCDTTYDQPETLLLTIFNVFLALASICIAAVLIYQIKANGEKWRWKKLLIRILIVCVNLFIITIFMWMYIDDRFPWFGAGKDCIDMPFTILLLIIFTGILLGSLIMRFLIFPALRHDEKP